MVNHKLLKAFGQCTEMRKNILDKIGYGAYYKSIEKKIWILQGRMKFPTGGIAHEPQGMIRCDSEADSIVWMREEVGLYFMIQMYRFRFDDSP